MAVTRPRIISRHKRICAAGEQQNSPSPCRRATPGSGVLPVQPPRNPYGGGGGAGQVPAHRAGGSRLCGSTAHDHRAQALSDQENPDGAVPEASGGPLPSFPLLHLRRHSWGHSTLLACNSVEASLRHTHRRLRARQTPFVDLKETATQRVRPRDFAFPANSAPRSLSFTALMDSSPPMKRLMCPLSLKYNNSSLKSTVSHTIGQQARGYTLHCRRRGSTLQKGAAL